LFEGCFNLNKTPGKTTELRTQNQNVGQMLHPRFQAGCENWMTEYSGRKFLSRLAVKKPRAISVELKKRNAEGFKREAM